MSILRVNRIESVSGQPIEFAQTTLSGSFQGDGSLITGVVSSSFSITSSFSNHVLYDGIINLPSLLSSSTQIQSEISGAFDSTSGSLSTRVTSLESFSSSLDSSFATDSELTSVSSSFSSTTSGLDSRLNTLESKTLLSSSIQIQSEISGAFTNVSSSFASSVDGLDSRLDTLESKTLLSGSNQVILIDTLGDLSGSRIMSIVASSSFAQNSILLDGSDKQVFATTGSNTFTGTQTFNNVVVNGTGSFSYIESVTGSAKLIGDAFIVVNNNTPAEPFGGLKVIDSGSENVTASLLWDGVHNHWIYEKQSGSTYGAGGFMSGPRSTDINNITYPTQYKIVRSQGGDHIYDSNITDNDTNVSIGIPLSVTGDITSSGIIKSSNGFEGNLTGTATTASYVSYTNIANIPSGIVSGSTQVSYLGLSNTPSGIVSGSTQVRSLLPVGTVSGSAQISLADITGTTFASSVFTFPSDVIISGSLLIQRGQEKIVSSATAATGTINFDALNQSILYYTTNASGNWTLNIRGNASTTLNNSMEIGRTFTIVFLATNGATPYRQTGFTIDGSAVTPKWQGGVAPAAGNASSIDSYSIVLIKTANATFTVLESQTRFA